MQKAPGAPAGQMKSYVVFLGSVLALCQSVQHSDEMHHHAEPIQKLGTVSFPISCSSNVQKPFELGVALLHSYWYEEAEKEFVDIAKDGMADGMEGELQETARAPLEDLRVLPMIAT